MGAKLNRMRSRLRMLNEKQAGLERERERKWRERFATLTEYERRIKKEEARIEAKAALTIVIGALPDHFMRRGEQYAASVHFSPDAFRFGLLHSDMAYSIEREADYIGRKVADMVRTEVLKQLKQSLGAT